MSSTPFQTEVESWAHYRAAVAAERAEIAQRLAVVHTATCDTLAIGRFVQYLGADEAWDVRAPVLLGSLLQPSNEFRDNCDCASPSGLAS